MRQRVSTGEHFRRGNAERATIRVRISDRNETILFGLIVDGKRYV